MTYAWEMCDLCGWMVRCPKCGMNCCSGGYGEVDGAECDACPLTYAFQDAEEAAGRRPKETDDEVDARKRRYHKAMTDAGIVFASLEELREL